MVGVGMSNENCPYIFSLKLGEVRQWVRFVIYTYSSIDDKPLFG
jgi:hypothetical protein